MEFNVPKGYRELRKEKKILESAYKNIDMHSRSMQNTEAYNSLIESWQEISK